MVAALRRIGFWGEDMSSKEGAKRLGRKAAVFSRGNL